MGETPRIALIYLDWIWRQFQSDKKKKEAAKKPPEIYLKNFPALMNRYCLGTEEKPRSTVHHLCSY